MKPTPFMGERHDIRSVEVPNPAPFNPVIWSPGAKEVCQIVSATFWLTTVVAVADRLVFCMLRNNAGKDGHFSFASVVQPASKAWTYYFTLGVAPLDFSAAENKVQAPFGCCYQLQGDEFFYIDPVNMQAGDTITDIVLRYFVWEKG